MTLNMTKVYVGFTAARGVLGGMIRWLTGGDVSHVFLLYFDQALMCWVNLGAEGSGFMARYCGTIEPSVKAMKYLYDVGDLKPGLVRNAEFVGADYDYKGLLGMAWVEFAYHRLKKQVKNPLDAKKAVFCSEIVRRVIEASPAVTLPLPKLEPGATDPEMLQRAVEAAGFRNLLSTGDDPLKNVA